MAPQTNQNMQKVLDSGAAKLLRDVVMLIMLPAVCWIGTQILSRLEDLSKQMYAINTVNATFEIRLNRIEQLVPKREAQLDAINKAIDSANGKQMYLEFRIKNLEDRKH